MAIAGTVIGRQTRGERLTRDEAPILHPWPLGHSAEPDDRHLWRVDDGENRLHATFAQAGDGDRGISQLRTAQMPTAGALNQIAEALHEGIQVLIPGIVQRRRHEPATAQGDSHAHMHRLARLETTIAIEAVELGKTRRRLGHRLDQQDP